MQVLERSGELVWTLLASLFIGLVVLVILNIQFAVLWAKLLYIPRHCLYAGITLLSVLGVYAISSATLDLWVLLAVGLLGFVMRRYGFPLAPVLIAVVLGPLAETELRRALTVSEGDPTVLVPSPVTLILYSVLVVALVISAVQHLRRRRGPAGGPAGSAGPDTGQQTAAGQSSEALVGAVPTGVRLREVR